MRRFGRIMGGIALALLGASGLAAGVVYAWSESILHRRYVPEPEPIVSDIMAPTLTRLARQRTDAELTTATRQGIAHDGRGLLVMTSAVHGRMQPEQTAALIAWWRSLRVKADRQQTPVDFGPAYAEGRYLTATVCTGCHGADVNWGPTPFADTNPSFGGEGNLPPSLDIAADDEIAALHRYLTARARRGRGET